MARRMGDTVAVWDWDVAFDVADVSTCRCVMGHVHTQRHTRGRFACFSLITLIDGLMFLCLRQCGSHTVVDVVLDLTRGLFLFGHLLSNLFQGTKDEVIKV